MTKEEAAREARNAYYRKWRKKNPDKVREHNQRYWEKRAAREAAAATAAAALEDPAELRPKARPNRYYEQLQQLEDPAELRPRRRKE